MVVRFFGEYDQYDLRFPKNDDTTLNFNTVFIKFVKSRVEGAEGNNFSVSLPLNLLVRLRFEREQE